jgi:hypothetical protein
MVRIQGGDAPRRCQLCLQRGGELGEILPIARGQIVIESTAQAHAEGDRHGEFCEQGDDHDHRKELVEELPAHAIPSIRRALMAR